ncbi:MAG: hypothetical protein Q8M94_22625, partial [Ignavibacteria bacterium]|nr:hypothetical protein [Ignavibacteria bacterium]
MLAINALNCWDTLKQILHNVTGNGKRDGLKSILMKQWAISNQASLKEDEGSTTKRSSLTLFGMAKLSRMGQFLSLITCKVAYAGIITVLFSYATVEARMVSMFKEHKISNSIVGNISIDVMDNLIINEKPSDVLFHKDTVMQDISSLVFCSRVVGFENVSIPTISYCKTRMERVVDFNAMCASNLTNIIRVERKYFGDFLRSHVSICHFSNNLGRWANTRDSWNVVIFHPDKNGFFTDTILSGNLQGGLQFSIFPYEVIFANEKFSFHAISISPMNLICQGKETRYSLDLVEKSRKQDKEPVDNKTDVKAMGDKVIVPTIPDVPVHDYKKGELFVADYLESPAIEMTVDKAKRFNFAVDEIDLKQMKIKDW